MTGGAGKDTFGIGANSLLPGVDDVILDYNRTEGDVLDLTEILDGLGLTAANIADGAGYVDIVHAAGNDYTVRVDHSGGGDGFVDVAKVTVTAGTSLTILFDDGQGTTDVPII